LSAVTLETRRLVLRQFRNSDLDAWAPICADEEVMRYLGTGVTLSRADAWRSMAGILGHWELLGYGMFALESKATGELIGRVGFLEPECWRARSGARAMPTRRRWPRAIMHSGRSAAIVSSA